MIPTNKKCDPKRRSVDAADGSPADRLWANEEPGRFEVRTESRQGIVIAISKRYLEKACQMKKGPGSDLRHKRHKRGDK